MIVYFTGKFVLKPVSWFASVGFDVNSMVLKQNLRFLSVIGVFGRFNVFNANTWQTSAHVWFVMCCGCQLAAGR
jgi:hypothetical protein